MDETRLYSTTIFDPRTRRCKKLGIYVICVDALLIFFIPYERKIIKMKYQCQGCTERRSNCHEMCPKYALDKELHRSIKREQELDRISISSRKHSWNYHRRK